MWRGNPVDGYYDTLWLTGICSAQAKVEGIVLKAKVEGIVLKATWHWHSDSSIVYGRLGEPGRTPLYVVLPSAWGSS